MSLWSRIRQYPRVVIAFCVLCIVGVGLLVYRRLALNVNDEGAKKLAEKVSEARDKLTVAVATASTQVTAARTEESTLHAEIKTIGSIPDPSQRRRELAALARRIRGQ